MVHGGNHQELEIGVRCAMGEAGVRTQSWADPEGRADPGRRGVQTLAGGGVQTLGWGKPEEPGLGARCVDPASSGLWGPAAC